MKMLLTISMMFLVLATATAQKVYTIPADSTKLTGCDSNELIIENHTQAIKGFLYNTGNGRTIFKRAVVKLNDTLYVVGADTLNIPVANFWSLNGNVGTDPSQTFLGTRDANDLVFRTGNTERMRLYTGGNLGLGTGSTQLDASYRLQVNGGIVGYASRHILGNLAIVKGSPVGYTGLATGIRIDDGPASFRFEGNIQSGAVNMFTFDDAYGGIGMDVTNDNQSLVCIKSGFKLNNITRTASVLHINPNYQIPTPLNNPLTVKGIYYDPILTNMPPGSKQIAMETTMGDVLLGTAATTKVGINTANPQANLDVTGNAAMNLKTEGDFMKIKVAGYTNWSRGIQYSITDSDGFSNPFGITLVGYNGSGAKSLAFNIQNASVLAFSGASCAFTSRSVFVDGFASQFHTDLPIILQSNTQNPNPTGIKFYAINASSTPLMSIMQSGLIGVGTTTPTAQFHTTGSVRLAGLTNNDTLTRIVVADANGNLSYRTVSSIIAGGSAALIAPANQTAASESMRVAAIQAPSRTEKMLADQQALLDRLDALTLQVESLTKEVERLKHRNSYK